MLPVHILSTIFLLVWNANRLARTAFGAAGTRGPGAVGPELGQALAHQARHSPLEIISIIVASTTAKEGFLNSIGPIIKNRFWNCPRQKVIVHIKVRHGSPLADTVWQSLWATRGIP